MIIPSHDACVSCHRRSSSEARAADLFGVSFEDVAA